MKLTPFELEILESILWQVEGHKIGRVTRRVTTRILRATIRRIRPRLIARSRSVASGRCERDHAVPITVICDLILRTNDLDRDKLSKIISGFLVVVELSPEEHTKTLKQGGVSSCMPDDWDGIDPLARYQCVGIELVDLSNGSRDHAVLT